MASDQRAGQAYFTVQLTVDRAPLKEYPKARIIPGMPVEVAIDTGTRTALDYFVEPISDVFRRGMRALIVVAPDADQTISFKWIPNSRIGSQSPPFSIWIHNRLAPQ